MYLLVYFTILVPSYGGTMKLLLLMIAALGLISCSSNPHKAKELDTKIDNAQRVNGTDTMGLKDGNMVVQKKVMMNEELRRIQNSVYESEDKVYGNRKYGSQGLYGALKSCKIKLSSKAYGGDGKLRWTEPIDRVTDKEDQYNIGLDETNKIVGVSEEFLLDRINRFKKYQMILNKREDEYKEKLDICDAGLRAAKGK